MTFCPGKIRHSSALLVFVLILNGLHWDLLGFCGDYVYGVFLNGAAEWADICYVCLPWVFFIFFLYYIPDNIFSRVHRKNLYLQIVVNNLIIRLIMPDLPKSFHRNVHIYTDFLSVEANSSNKVLILYEKLLILLISHKVTNFSAVHIFLLFLVLDFLDCWYWSKLPASNTGSE